jgi:hypothetical protein
MSSTSATTAAKRFIAPFVAAMDASGAAAFDYVQQETVSIAGIQYEFDRTLLEPGSANLLNCFTVSGNGPSGEGFQVTVSDAAALHAIIKSVIHGNGESADALSSLRSANNKTPTQQFIADLHAGLTAAIGDDDLINTVENLDVTDVDVTIDASGGASNMIDGLTDARCNLIYTQIPKETLNVYMDASENQVTSALPLQKGDVLTFVFDVNLSDVVPVKSYLNTGADATALSDPLSGTAVFEKYTSSLHYDLPSTRIAINVRMTADESGAIEGLKA